MLLDRTFHATHCFNAVRGRDEFVGMLGLEGSVAELIFQGDTVEITQYGATATYQVPDRILRLDLEVPATVPGRQ